MTSPIYALSDSYIDRLAVLDPGAATYMGIPGHDHEMTDFSPEGHDARAALDHDVLAKLNALDASANADRLAAGVLRESLEMGTLEYAANEHLRSIRVIAGDVDAGRSIFDLMPTDTAEQWAVIAERMSQVPRAFAGMRQSWALGAQRGALAQRRQVLASAEQLGAWAGRGAAPAFLNSSLKALLQLPVRRLNNCARQQRLRQRHLARRLIICAMSTRRLRMLAMVLAQIAMPSRDADSWV